MARCQPKQPQLLHPRTRPQQVSHHVTIPPPRTPHLGPQPQLPHLAPALASLRPFRPAGLGPPELERGEEELAGLQVGQDGVAEEEGLGERAQLAGRAGEGDEGGVAGAGVGVGGRGEGVRDDQEEEFGGEEGEAVGVEGGWGWGWREPSGGGSGQ